MYNESKVEYEPAVTNLDETIEEMDEEVARKIMVVEIKRCERTQNMLRDEPYNSLCTAATEGKITQGGGGPNCRSWSVLRLIPLANGAGKPCRGRDDTTCWGLPELQEPDRDQDRKMTDDDSVLALRMMYILWLAKRSGALIKAAWTYPQHSTI